MTERTHVDAGRDLSDDNNSAGKESAMQETLVQFLGQQDPTLAQRRDMLPTPVFLGFPGGSDCKESVCNAGDLGSVPGLGRYPGGRHDNPLQYSCLENPVDRGAWWATVDGVTKSRT